MTTKLTAHAPTIILVGGRYVTDGGDRLDSRQAFADDPHSAVALKTLAVSELWWQTVASVVLPLLEARGGDAVANIGGPRTVMVPNLNGAVLRRRLASVLPGGVRTAKKPTAGKWRLIDMGQMWQDDADAAVVVDTWGWYWFNARSASDYTHFEELWLKHNNLVIVAPHTHAARVFLDGYVRWVAEGRYPHTLDMPLHHYDWDLSQIPVVPVEADFRVTGVLQGGSWLDPAPLEAARALLQARFDLRIGLWDLATNDTLRTTLLRETPVLDTPEAVASRPAPVVAREQRMKADRTPEQVERDNAWAAAAEDLKALDAHGWTANLSASSSAADREGKYSRSLLLAAVPEADPSAGGGRPVLRPGQPVLWLCCNFQPAIAHTVELVVAPPMGGWLNHDISMHLYFDNWPALEKASEPFADTAKSSGGRSDGLSFHSIASFGGPNPAGWCDRITFITERTPLWLSLLQPIIESCHRSIRAANRGAVPARELPLITEQD